MTDLPPRTHNLPPIEEHKQRTDKLINAADEWREKVPEIKDEDTAAKGADFLVQLRDEYKAAEADRKKEKQPHVDAGKAVDAAYAPLKTRLEKAADKMKALLGVWERKKREEADAERRRREEEAEKARQEAERLAAEAAKKGGIDAEIEAEEAAKAAKAAEKAASTDTYQGTKGQLGKRVSLRTIYYGVIEDHNKALAVYAHDPLIVEALEKAINRDVRAGKRDIPGVKIKSEQKAA